MQGSVHVHLWVFIRDKGWKGGRVQQVPASWGWSGPSSSPSSRPRSWSGEPSPTGPTESSTTQQKLWKHSLRCAVTSCEALQFGFNVDHKVRAKAATIKEGDTSVTYVPVPGPKTSVIRDFEGSKCQTMADVWDWSVRRYFSHSKISLDSLAMFWKVCRQATTWYARRLGWRGRGST